MTGRHGLVAAALLLLAAGIVLARLLPMELGSVLAALRGLGAAGWLALGVAQVAVAVSGVLPAALLGVAAGTLYGLLPGFALAASATLAGAWLAFGLSRSVCRPLVARKLAGRPLLADLDARVAREGWRLVLLLRVSPVMPFSATSYALGLSSVRRRDYLLGTLAALPALFGYVLIGTLAGAAAGEATLVRRLVLAAGLAATLVLVLRGGRLLTGLRPASG